MRPHRLWRHIGVAFAAWVLMAALVVWGVHTIRDINRHHCRVTERALVETFEDLGAELDAPPERVEGFVRRIEARFDNTPDC